MNAKGYRFFPNRKTDLLVAFHIVLMENETVTTLDNYSGLRFDGQPDVLKRILRNFRIRIIRDKRPKEFWSSISSIQRRKSSVARLGEGRLRLVQPGEKLQDLAKLAVDQILAKLPSRR